MSSEEYRRQAAHAKKQARLARNDAERESWLWIAQGWMGLLRKRPPSNEQVFNSSAKTREPGRTIPNLRIRAASVFHLVRPLAIPFRARVAK
jgi:hypothetical protein